MLYSQNEQIFIPITENKGQLLNTDDTQNTEVLFYSDGDSKTYHFQTQTVSYVFNKMDTTHLDSMLRVDMHFANSNATPTINGVEQVSKMNYFLPHTGADGIVDVPVVNKVAYRNLYTGIDVWAVNEGLPNYEFVIAAGADETQIELDWDGVTSVALTPEGSAKITTAAGVIEYVAPTAYQVIGGVKTPVTVRYELNGTTLGFKWGSFDNTYNITLLVAHKPAPPIPYFYGNVYWGTRIDAIRLCDVKINANNEIFAIGYANTYPFPPLTPGQYHNSWGINTSDAFVVKFKANRGIEWATLLGGSGDDIGTHIALAPNGAVYCSSSTLSDNFVTYQGTMSNSIFHAAPSVVPSYYTDDVVLTKLNPLGKVGSVGGAISTFSTYFGGNGSNYINALVVDDANNLFFGGLFKAGANGGFNFATLPSQYISTYQYYQAFTSYGGGFIAQLNVSDQMPWCSALANGAGNLASVHSLAKDANGGIYVYGVTSAVAGTLVVGPANQFLNNIYPYSNVFPTVKIANSGSYVQATNNGGQDAFIMKFITPNGNGLEWSTLFGGDAIDGGSYILSLTADAQGGIAVDNNGNIFIASGTYSDATYFPLQNLAGAGVYNDPSQNGDKDGFIARFNTNGVKQWCTYYGSDVSEKITSISINGGGSLNVCGNVAYSTLPTNFPLKQRSGTYYQAAPLGVNTSGFIAQFDLDGIRQFSTYYGYNDGDVNAITNDATNNHIVSVGNCVIGRNIPNTNLDYFVSLPVNQYNAGISNILQGCVGCQRFGEAEDEIPSDIVLAPNPAKAYFSLENPHKVRIEVIYLYNNAGQVVKTYENIGEVLTYNFDIRTLPTGLYHLQIHTIEGIHNHKLIIE